MHSLALADIVQQVLNLLANAVSHFHAHGRNHVKVCDPTTLLTLIQTELLVLIGHSSSSVILVHAMELPKYAWGLQLFSIFT